MVDEFTQRLAEIDQQRVKSFLAALPSPCYESELLRIAFPTMDISRADPLLLYQNHFLLFHVLYQLQNEFYHDGQYLFIHFMRTIVVPYPERGFCRYFDETFGRFCQTECPKTAGYCAFHAERISDTALDELSVRYFYLDAQNFYRLDAQTATAFINGTWEMLTHYDAYRNSFEILGLPETTELKVIKKRFKQLAMQYHPDRGASSHEQFQAINNAYRLLLHLHGVMSNVQPSTTA